MKRRYKDPITGLDISTRGNKLHDHYWKLLENTLKKQGYIVTSSYDLGSDYKPGEWWRDDEAWHELDLLAEKNGEKIAIEIIVHEIYGIVRKKILKIKKSLGNVRIVIFEPIMYLNEFWLEKRSKVYEESFGHKPKSYIEIEELAKKKWKEEDNLDVEFWNEKHLM